MASKLSFAVRKNVNRSQKQGYSIPMNNGDSM